MTMVDWRETTLGEICDEADGVIQTGPFGSQLHESDYSLEGIPVVMPKDIIEGRISKESVARVSPEHVERLSRHKLQSGDIVYGRRGDIGRQALIRPEQEGWMCGTGCLRLSFGESVLNPLFLHYYLRQEDVVSWITNQAVGATMPNLNTGILRSVPVKFPRMLLQRRIAGILSAYDELIENSQRRIKILETMARTLYREWFVHFRFPGHEKIPLVASSLGEIPQGWEVKRVPECIEINPRVVVPRDGEKAFVPMGCLSNDSMLISDVESREGNSGAKFQNGDTLFARITPCLENGKTGFVQFLPDSHSVAFGSTEFIVLRSRTLSPEFVYLLARSDEFRGVAIKSMSGASGRQRVQEKCFDDFQIAQPPQVLIDGFSAIVAPSFKIIYKLRLQIQNLRKTRDLLLPRLLSGQVQLNVDAAEQQLAEARAESLQATPAPVVYKPTTRKPASEPSQLKVAETAPPTYATDKPPDINDTDRTEVLCAIRALFSDGVARDRATAIRDLAHALGYQRTGSRIQEVVSTDLLTAVRRGIVVNERGEYSLGFRSVDECTRDSMKNNFESAIGRGWIHRDDAVRAFARWLGFARVGKVIDDTARSLINGLIREDRLETDGPALIRRR